MKTTHWLLNRQVLSALLAAPMLLSATAFADEAAPAAAVEAAAPAAEAAKEPASPWTLSANINFTSDYYARGVSQSWHQPAIQGGFDVSHASGFYAGVWGSSISERTYVGASTEVDFYGGYNGTIGAVEGLGYGLGVIGYYYPGGGWNEYQALTDAVGNKGAGVRDNSDFTTWEANFGLSYKWVSAKVSYTLTDWYGASKDTGWSESTDGSLYYELNALVPLPVWGLNLIAHVGRLDVQGELSLNPDFLLANSPDATAASIVETKADMTDWKIGLSKSFEIAGAAGYNASLVYVGGSNGGSSGYWGTKGYGGSSFTQTLGSKDLTDDRVVLTVGRSF